MHDTSPEMEYAVTSNSSASALLSRAAKLWWRPTRYRVIIMPVSVVYLALLVFSAVALLAPPRLSMALDVPSSREARVAYVVPGSFSWECGVRAADRVLALDGQDPAGLDSGWWSGQQVLVRIHDGAVVALDAKMIRSGHDAWPLLLLSPWFMLLGTLVFLRAEAVVGRASYVLLGSAAFGLALAPAADADRPLAVVLEPALVLAFAASFALFFLVFPARRGSLRLRAAVVFPALIVAMLSVLAVVWPRLYPSVSTLRAGAWLLYLLLGSGLIAYSFVTARESDSRRGLAITGVTTILSVLPFASLYLLPTLLGQPAYVTAEHSVLALALLPAGFAYAILRHRVVNVPLVQRWLVHGLLWLALLATYTAVIYAQYRIFEPLPEPARSIAGAATLALMVGVSLSWLRGWLRSLLDRLIFKDSYDYRASLQGLSRNLSVASDLESLAASLPNQLCRLMNLDFAALLVNDQDDARLCGAAGKYREDMLPALAVAARAAVDAPMVVSLAYGYLEVLLVPLRVHGAIVGHLCLGPKASGEPFRGEDRDLLTTISGQVGAIVRNAQLIEDLRTKVEALDALNERMQHAIEEERARLASDIHDEPLQTAIHLQRRLKDAEDIELSQRVIEQLRVVCTTIRPPALSDLGLQEALDALALEQSERSGVPVVLDLDTEMSGIVLPPATELVLYRTVQEAVNNSLRHARPGTVRISLRSDNGHAKLLVTDDGVGFVMPGRFDSLAAKGHLGLAGLRQRVEQAGGRLVVSSSPGEGTIIGAYLPLGDAVT